MKPADLLIMVVVMLAVTYLGALASAALPIGVVFFKRWIATWWAVSSKHHCTVVSAVTFIGAAAVFADGGDLTIFRSF